MKDLKRTTQEYVSLDQQSSGGCSMGCIGIGCLGAVAMLVMMCGGGFYGLLYTSLPLRAIEAAIEADENVEIEGLAGNFTNGFTVEKFRFKSHEDEWSQLNNIKFKYRNNRLFNPDRSVIEEISVESGTIYADWDPEQSELNFAPDISSEIEEINEELADVQKELEGELGRGLDQIKELRLDLVRFTDLEIINPETEEVMTIDEVKFDGFKWENGELTSLGTLFVRSSQLELDTVDSVRFSDDDYSQRIEGVIKPQMDRRVANDVTFHVDFALANNEFKMHGDAFDEKMEFIFQEGNNRIRFASFSPVDYLEINGEHIAPSELNYTVEFGSSDDDVPQTVNPDGSFRVGATVFNELTLGTSDQGKVGISGRAKVDGQDVNAILVLVDRSPFWLPQLRSESGISPRELWAQTVYGKSFAELDEAKQQSVTAMLDLKPKKRKVDMRSNEEESGVEIGEVEDLLEELEAADRDSTEESANESSGEADVEESAPFPLESGGVR